MDGACHVQWTVRDVSSGLGVSRSVDVAFCVQWSARVTSSGRACRVRWVSTCRGNGLHGHHFLDCKPGGCFCQVLRVKSPQNPGANPRKNREERNAGNPSQKIGKFPLLRFGICGIIGSFGGVLSGTEGLYGSQKHEGTCVPLKTGLGFLQNGLGGFQNGLGASPKHGGGGESRQTQRDLGVSPTHGGTREPPPQKKRRTQKER